MAKKAYQCKDCGNEVIVEAAAKTPDCHGKPMTEIDLDSCSKPHNSESARFGDEDPACDDGVK